MPITNMGTRWDQGKLEYFDVTTGSNIAVFNPATKTLEIPAGATLDASTGTLTLPTGAVTFTKAKVFVSAERTGTGASENIAHGLGAAPAAVLIVPTDTTPVTTGAYTATEGAHTSTNVVVTVTSGKKYKVMAWA